MGQTHSWEAELMKKSIPPFIGSEVSLPCSQDPATGLYPEPDETSMYLLYPT
jgi:hypothetical protein